MTGKLPVLRIVSCSILQTADQARPKSSFSDLISLSFINGDAHVLLLANIATVHAPCSIPIRTSSTTETPHTQRLAIWPETHILHRVQLRDPTFPVGPSRQTG